MELSYEDALEYYYSYKQRYEKKYNKLKGKIMNDKSMSKKQKQEKIKNIKMPCISCKKKVGTLFQEKDKILYAVCGNQESPCNLNIQIKKATTLLTDSYVPNLIKEKNIIQNDIIRLKLSHIFGLIDDDELSEVFEELKTKLNDVSELLEITDKFLKNTLETDMRREQIKLLNVEKYNNVKTIKNLISEYLSTKDNELLKDAVALNIENTNEVLDKLRANKYREMFIEPLQMKEKTMIHLVQNENSLQDKEFEAEGGEVLYYEI